MTLSSWQKITRVLPNQPFGNGSDGAYSSATAPSLVHLNMSGTSGAKTVTPTSTTFADDDLVVLIQSRGSTAGNWEFNRVASGGGTTTLTMQENLKYTYATDASNGPQKAQIIKIFQYTTAEATGNWYVPTLDGNIGGIMFFAANVSFFGAGSLLGIDRGHRGGGGVGQNTNGYRGEGSVGESIQTYLTSVNAGGGGVGGADAGCGGGGAHASTGGNGSNQGSHIGGQGGTISGNAALTSMTLPGAGGSGGGDEDGSYSGAGGRAAGIIAVFARGITISGYIQNYGAGGADGVNPVGTEGMGGGGGAAGGSVLLVGQDINIGTNKIDTRGGAGGISPRRPTVIGGAGSKGRVAIYYGSSLSGSLSSTYYGSLATEQDTDLVPGSSVKANILHTYTQDNAVKSNILVSDNAYSQSTKMWIAGTAANHTIASIYAASIRKYYQYRVYDQNNQYVGVWADDVITEPTFRTSINSGPSEMMVRLARNFDNFGEDVDVKLYNHVEVWCFDRDNRNGTLIYSGFISGYRPVLDGYNEYVEITLLHDVVEMSWIMLRNGAGETAISQNSTDPSDMFRTVLDYYRADRPKIDYSTDSVDDTGTTVSYTFTTYTIKEALDKIVELTPEDWYWRIDPDNVAHLHASNVTTADHKFVIGKHISQMETWRRGEDIINTVYFVGQESAGVPMYRVYENTGSIDAYGIHALKYVDQRVTQTATADTMSNRIIDKRKDPEVRTKITIVDNNQNRTNIGYNIESIKPGQTMKIQNINQGVKTVSKWDIAEWDVDVWDQTLSYTAADIIQILSVDYTPSAIIIEASSRLPDISKRVEDVNRNLEESQTYNTPTSPTAG